VDIPPRTATETYLSWTGGKLDIVFDADLGELIEGHHVVVRGIMFGVPVEAPAAGEAAYTEASLFYEFVPGLTEERTSGHGFFSCYWMLSAADDAGTEYHYNNLGSFDPRSGGAATRGIRQIGGQPPAQARRLIIRFEPPLGWTPPEPWRHEIVVDLHEKRLAD
jgi:hypothetical protein